MLRSPQSSTLRVACISCLALTFALGQLGAGDHPSAAGSGSADHPSSKASPSADHPSSKASPSDEYPSAAGSGSADHPSSAAAGPASATTGGAKRVDARPSAEISATDAARIKRGGVPETAPRARQVTVAITVDPRRPDGGRWDRIGRGTPDLKGRIAIASKGRARPFRIESKDKTFLTQYRLGVLEIAPGDRIELDLWDEDLLGKNRVGNGHFEWDGSARQEERIGSARIVVLTGDPGQPAPVLAPEEIKAGAAR